MRTLAQKAAMVFGIVFLAVGLLGLFTENGMTMDASMETAPRLFGLFPINLAHNIVHIAFGVWGLIAARSLGGARSYGRIGAVIYGLLVVLAFIDPTTFGLVPIGSHDIWLHAVLAAGLAFIGWGPSGEEATARA